MLCSQVLPGGKKQKELTDEQKQEIKEAMERRVNSFRVPNRRRRLRVDGTDPKLGGLYGPPSKGHHGVCAICSETTVIVRWTLDFLDCCSQSSIESDWCGLLRNM